RLGRWATGTSWINEDGVIMAGGTYPLDSDGAAARMSIAATRWQVVRRHAEDGESLTQIAQDAGLALRTVQRWNAAYRRAGIAGLAPAQAWTRGRRTQPAPPALTEGRDLSTPRRSSPAIARNAQTNAAQQGWPMVAYTTVRSIVGSLDPGMVMLAHHGPVA